MKVRGTGVGVAVIVSAIALFGCGDDADQGGAEEAVSPGPDIVERFEEGEGAFVAARGPLEEAGFTFVGAGIVLACGIPNEPPNCSDVEIGSRLETEKDGAEFEAYVFDKPEYAADQAESSVEFSEENGWPAELDGTFVFYSSKCCIGDEPPPVVPQADYDEFVEITRSAVE